MSNEVTKHMLMSYESNAPRTSFLTGFFQTPIENFHTSESVEFDVIRNEEEIAYAVYDLSVDGNMNENTLFTNKEFVPPIFDEVISLNSYDMLKREFGSNPFENGSYIGKAGRQLNRGVRKLDEKIMRSIEQMSAQVLQTGQLALLDQAGNPAFAMDFKPKASHFPVAPTSWSTGTANIENDINSLTEVVRNDGKIDINTLIMGEGAWFNFKKDPVIAAQLDNRRFELGFISPEFRGNGQTRQGVFTIGNYRYEVFTYSGRYFDGTSMVKYIADDKVIFLNSDPSQTRLDLTFGDIPRILNPDPRLSAMMPSAFGSSERGMRLTTNIWVTDNNKHIKASAGTRPLTIPTAIDTFACLDTEV